MASIPTSGIHTVAFNDTVCRDLGFDAFNGTHCYTEGTSEWTNSPTKRVFESFEDLYNFVDDDRKTRLLDILHHYHEKQSDTTEYLASSSWYWYILVLVFMVLFIEVVWQVWTYDSDNRASTRRLWPWKNMKGANVYMNELMVRTVLLFFMALINSTLWIIVLPLLCLALTGRLVRTIQKRGEPTSESSSESGSEADE